ncbi:MAG: hypothetical protein IT276_12335 [Ignavibacteriaceae bacterium]|nr:hypothetical protein [Ignavibacteriaceae bacterium]HRN26718.1 hypothetical protein [Ignavibacteriaceae bacterium]
MINLFMKKIMFVILLAVLFSSCNKNNESDIDEENLKNEIANAKLTEFSGFYFVGSYNGKPAIYRYDYEFDKYRVFWHSIDERVIDLLVSPNNKSAYFITKRQQRLKSSQPAIEKGRLYRIDFDVRKVESITQLEEGIQIIPFWTDNDRFTLVINSIDKIIASYINKNTQIYNRFGKLLSDNTEIFDLTKDGYPITKLPTLNYKSPNELFTVIEKNDSIFIGQQNSNKEVWTGFSSNKIIQLNWAENKKQLVMLIESNDTLKLKTKNINEAILVVYDLQKKKTVKKFNATSYNRFVLIGDFLIFGSGFGKDSYIEIFKLESLTSFKIIKINGGCSLRSV